MKKHIIFWWLAVSISAQAISSEFDSKIEHNCEPSFITNNLNESDVERKIEVRFFVVTNYRALAHDLVNGEGEYLTALRELIFLSDIKQPKLIIYGRCLLATEASISTIARKFSSLIALNKHAHSQ